MNNIILIITILTLTLFGSFGGYFFKKSTGCASILAILKSKYLYIGCFFYVIGALLNILVLKYLPYSVVLPLTSITYFWTLIISYFFLNEKVTKFKIIGIIMILVGASFIGFSTI
jgi:drug/metabolite transporter (DMT)-like permease